jgi:hypothetical protein
MAETRDGVVASAGTRFVDRKFESVADMEVRPQLCHGLHGEAELGGPRNRGSRRRSLGFVRRDVRRQTHRSG